LTLLEAGQDVEPELEEDALVNIELEDVGGCRAKLVGWDVINVEEDALVNIELEDINVNATDKIIYIFYL